MGFIFDTICMDKIKIRARKHKSIGGSNNFMLGKFEDVFEIDLPDLTNYDEMEINFICNTFGRDKQ